MSTLHAKLTRAVALSNRILKAVDDQEWERSQQLDEERLALLKEIFSDTELDPGDELTKASLEQISRLNDQALAQCNDSRSRMISENKSLQRAKTAISAYMKNQS